MTNLPLSWLSCNAELSRTAIFDPATLIKKGLCTVAKDRAPTTHRLYYEIHGDQSGENVERIVFVMGALRISLVIHVFVLRMRRTGLNNSSFGWDSLVRRFAPVRELTRGVEAGNGPCEQKGGYQVLVFDNRGVGNSDAPKGLYKCVRPLCFCMSARAGWPQDDRDGAGCHRAVGLCGLVGEEGVARRWRIDGRNGALDGV